MFAASKTDSVSTGGAPDDKFNYVTMLLHGDGTNGAQNNTFVDSSSNNFTITRNGNTTQGTFSPYGSNWSNYFNGSSYLSLGTATALGTGNVTVEFWFYPTDISATYYALYEGRTTAGTDTGFGIFQYGQTIEIYGNGLKVSSASSAFTANTWNHFAVVRTSGTCQIYINGVASGSSANYSNDLTSTTRRIGQNASGLNTYTGYISNLREVTSALYSGTFTPSTTPLTAVSGTTLLTCQSNRFIDNSTNAYAITVSGTPSVQRFNPFGTSSAYSTSVIGGSGYFDGDGDYLTAASTTAFDIASGTDFTFSCWVYFTSNPNNGTVKYIFDQTSTSGSGSVIFLAQETGNAWTACSMANAYSSSDFVAGQWYWITISRVSGTLRSFKNGTLITSGANTDASDTNRFTIAARYSDNYILNSAYLTDVRFVVGSGVTSDTVPTAPASPITNTALLCNMTNGAIFDNAMMNDLETVGNAQISTSVVKYGTGSIAFDETGDYLTLPPTTNVSFGTGNFTIELWARFATSTIGNGQGLFQLSNGYLNSAVRGPAVGCDDSSGKWAIYYGTSSEQHASLIPSTNTWYHVAYVRNSGTTKLYIDGTEIISVADTTNYTDTNFTVGGWYSSSFLLNGYIDDIRITKGYARYTTTFTPPTAAFSDKGPY